MKRRSLLIGVGVLASFSGCMGNEGGGFVGDDDDDAPGDVDADADEDREDGAETLRSEFEGRDLMVIDVTLEEGRIAVDLQTTGDLDEDIRIAAGAFATVARDVGEDIHVRIEDRGLSQDSFIIEYEWATDFADQQLSDEEYLDLINETRN